MQLRLYTSVCVLLLNIWTVVANTDPYSCCRNRTMLNVGPWWDCKRCGLQSVPPNPPADAKAVSLEANNITEIPIGSFRNYQNVAWLQLTNNSLTLENDTAHFDGLSNLNYLSIARNHIVLSDLSEQNQDIFKPLENLTVLNMYRIEYNIYDDRHFVEYPGKFLAPLNKLRRLTLPVVSFQRMGNYMSNLTQLNSLAFLQSMPSAKILWKTMKNETFQSMTMLQSLILIDSSVKTIESHALQPLQRLSKLEVFCSDLQAIELLKAIENLPNPSLETLIFEYDKSIADVKRNETFASLAKLSWVTMGIPVMVPHPNPFVLDFLPIFWENVTKLEIIRPYADVYVDTVFRNPDDLSKPELQITVSNTIKYVPDRSACIMTSQRTKLLPEELLHSAIDQHMQMQSDQNEFVQDGKRGNSTRYEPIHVAQRQHEYEVKKENSKRYVPKHEVKRKHELETHDLKMANKSQDSSSGEPRSSPPSKEDMSTKNVTEHGEPNYSDQQALAGARFTHPDCYSGYFSPNICYRLLSLTLAFYFSYTQSQVFDLVIREGRDLGIKTELLNLTVNKLLYHRLPGNAILDSLVAFNIKGAGVKEIDSRNMSRLRVYDMSENSIGSLCNTNAVSILHNLQLFNVSNNGLKCIDKNSFESATNLTQIDLTKNKLENILLNISHLKKLEQINLTSNNIKYFAEDFTNQIVNHSKVCIDLSDNPLTCGCGPEYIAFVSWMIQNKKFFINFEDYTCRDMYGATKPIKAINIREYQAECRSKLPIYIAIPVACCVASIIIITMTYRHRWRMMWYMYTIINSCHRQRRPRRPNHNRDDLTLLSHSQGEVQSHDIFLSFSQEDVEIRSAVLEKLLEYGYSLMHYELFEWGKCVFLQSVIGIQQCNKVVFLVTKNFAKCKMCDFQLHMSVINGMENMIFLQVDSALQLNQAGMGPFLRNLLQIDADKTFDYADNDNFWNMLRAKLPKSDVTC